VGRLVLVDQDDRGGSVERRSRPSACGGQARRSIAQRVPRGGPLRIRHARVQPHHAPSFARRCAQRAAVSMSAAMTSTAPGRSRCAERALLAPGADQELGPIPRVAPVSDGSRVAVSSRAGEARPGVASRGWRQERGAGRADRREALTPHPLARSRWPGESTGSAVDHAVERLQPRVGAVPDADDHAHARGTAKRRDHALTSGERPAVGHAVRERMGDGNVEATSAMVVTAFFCGRTPVGELEVFQAMRLYSSPGLRRRNAG